MKKIFVGYTKDYQQNWDRIFNKTLLQKIRDFLDNLLYKLFLNGDK